MYADILLCYVDISFKKMPTDSVIQFSPDILASNLNLFL